MPLSDYHKDLGTWSPGLRHLATDAVLAASDDLVEVRDRLEIGRQELVDARAAFDKATVDDQVAAVDAAEKGTPPPKPRAEKAQAKLADAERHVEALESLTVKRSDRYLAKVVEDHGVLVENATTEVQRTVPAVEAAIANLAEKLILIGDCELILKELGDGEWLQGRSVSFHPAREGRQLERDALDGDTRSLLDGLLAKLAKPEYQRAAF